MFLNTYRYYVYATSKTAATSLVEKVLAEENGAVQKYLDILSAGGSEYPVNILKKAGVDLTSSEPFEKTIDAMVRDMDEIEEILEKKGK
jgi:oligoendopeptidase F